MSTEPSLAEKVILLDRTLTDAGLGYAYGGALALAYYGEPRVTVDLDLNLFAPPSAFPSVAEQLASLDVKTEVRTEEVELEGKARMWWGRNPVDLFFAYDPLHEAMEQEARGVDFGDSSIRILAPEHLLVCKVVFDRRKDWLDVEQMLVGVEGLRSGEVFGWLEHIVGQDNQRLDRLQELWDRTR